MKDTIIFVSISTRLNVMKTNIQRIKAKRIAPDSTPMALILNHLLSYYFNMHVINLMFLISPDDRIPREFVKFESKEKGNMKCYLWFYTRIIPDHLKINGSPSLSVFIFSQKEGVFISKRYFKCQFFHHQMNC